MANPSTKPSAVIVVPTIRERCIAAFLRAWQREFENATILVIEDNPEPTFDLGERPNLFHYSWQDIDAELAASAWIVPRRTDCVRSFGYWKAWQQQPDLIVTLDDDCYPVDGHGRGFLAEHWQRLERGGDSPAWTSTLSGVVPRGVPYEATNRRWRCAINHGLWTEVPDFDALTQLQQRRDATCFRPIDQTVPVGQYYPMCGMNLAFRTELAPAMYFLLMGEPHGYDRFGDIWAGVLTKKICDHLHLAVRSGAPAVRHSRASNVWANLQKEAPGMPVNEQLWHIVDSVTLTSDTVPGCYLELAAAIESAEPFDRSYQRRLGRAMRRWVSLFEPRTIVPAPRREAAITPQSPVDRDRPVPVGSA